MLTTLLLLLVVVIGGAWSREASKCQVDLLIVMDMSGTQNYNRTAIECSREKADFVQTLANRISSDPDVDNFIAMVAFSTDIRPGSSNYFNWNRYEFNNNRTWNSMAGLACGGLTKFVPASRKALELMEQRNAATFSSPIDPIKELVIVSDGRWDDSESAEWHSLPDRARALGYHITAVMIGSSAEVMGPSSQKNMLALVSSKGNKVIWDRTTALETVSERILAGFENAQCLDVKPVDNAVLGGGDQCMCPCACNQVGATSPFLPTHSSGQQQTPVAPHIDYPQAPMANNINNDYNVDYAHDVDDDAELPPPPSDAVLNAQPHVVSSGYVRRA